jgi:hypothetical protein
MDSNALTWIVITNVTTCAASIASVLGVFRRKPPIEAEFSNAEKNSEAHAFLHRRIDKLLAECPNNHRDLLPREIYQREIEQRDEWRHEVNTKLEAIQRGITALAVKADVEVEL